MCFTYICISQRWHSSYLCTRVHLISRKQSWLSCKSFRSIFFPSNLNYCCNDYILCIALYFSIHFHFHWKNNINFTKMITKKKEKSYRSDGIINQVINSINEGLKSFITNEIYIYYRYVCHFSIMKKED